MSVPKRIASALMNSLNAGVVPRIGLPFITVGRKNEIDALLRDVETVGNGGASFRFIVGRYGSGKTFLMQTLRNYAMEKNFVVADADLSPDRRLHGTTGQGLATYRELMRNMATKTRPEGGALELILDRWLDSVRTDVLTRGDAEPGTPDFDRAVEKEIAGVVGSVRELVHGFDFAMVLTAYYRAYVNGDGESRAKVVKWFRGEYSTKTEVKNALGVSALISDENWYDYLKVFALFLKKAGYGGLIVMIDELVNLFKITNSVTRQNNYEKILTMLNDTMQGGAQYLGIILGATEQCLEDRRRGIYSYEALSSRLQEGRFAREGYVNLLSPVIRLEPLTEEELYVLIEKLADIHAGLYGYENSFTRRDYLCFLQTEFGRVGAGTRITPREVIRDFIELADILYQNPSLKVAEILGSDGFSFASGESEAPEDDGFAEFEL